MACGSVRHFVAKNGRETGFGLSNRQNAGVNDHLSAGQAESIHLWTVNKAHLPVESFRGAAGCSRNALSDPMHRFRFAAGLDNVRGREDLLISLQAERLLLLAGHRNTFGSASYRIGEFL